MRLPRPAAAATLAAAAIAACGGTAATATEPRAPASYDEIVEYRDSGEWDADITERIDAATDALTTRLDSGTATKPAIVLDVDDTSLSNYECLKDSRFRQSARQNCSRAGRLPAIPQTLELFRYARSRNVTVVFITGRRQRVRSLTDTNLREAGYDGSFKLYLRPNRERRGTHDGWKARTRRSLVRRGYSILVNVGDQRSDLTGGYAQRKFKLPNPMYVIPTA